MLDDLGWAINRCFMFLGPPSFENNSPAPPQPPLACEVIEVFYSCTEQSPTTSQLLGNEDVETLVDPVCRGTDAATAHTFISNDAGRFLALIGGLSVYPMIYIGFQHLATLLLVFFSGFRTHPSTAVVHCRRR